MNVVTQASTEFDQDTCPELAESLVRFEGGFVLQNVGDYAPGDPATAKMATPYCKGEIGTLLPPVSCRPLDTKQGSFRAAMLALAPREQLGDNVFFYLNVAPIDSQADRNGHHQLCVAVLTNGRIIAGPNAGFSFSFFKDWIKKLYVISCKQEGVQFRSWMSFPQELLRLLGGDYSVIEADITDRIHSLIPDFPQDFVTDEDAPFENLRLSVTFSEFSKRTGFASGDLAYVCRNGIPVHVARFGKPRSGAPARLNLLSLDNGSNILQPFDDDQRVVHLDLFRVHGSAKRECVMNVEDYRKMPFIGVPLEALAVFSAALRMGFPLKAVVGFFGVLTRRISEWWNFTGEWERPAPVITFRKKS